eukprot:1087456-Prorocentrum_minimum.AAC.1
MLSVELGFVDEMLTWLEADLADVAADPLIRWAVAFFHHSPFSRGHHDSDVSPEMVGLGLGWFRLG